MLCNFSWTFSRLGAPAVPNTTPPSPLEGDFLGGTPVLKDTMAHALRWPVEVCPHWNVEAGSVSGPVVHSPPPSDPFPQQPGSRSNQPMPWKGYSLPHGMDPRNT